MSYGLRLMDAVLIILAIWLAANLLILPLALLGHWIADKIEARASR